MITPAPPFLQSLRRRPANHTAHGRGNMTLHYTHTCSFHMSLGINNFVVIFTLLNYASAQCPFSLVNAESDRGERPCKSFLGCSSRHDIMKRPMSELTIYASIFLRRMSLSVTASAANFEMPSRSFSTAICSSLKSKRKVASSLMYVFLSRLSDDAPDASSFLGTESCELNSCSRRLG